MVVSVHETQEECYFEDFMPLSGQNICFHALKVGLRVDFDEEKFKHNFFLNLNHKYIVERVF